MQIFAPIFWFDQWHIHYSRGVFLVRSAEYILEWITPRSFVINITYLHLLWVIGQIWLCINFKNLTLKHFGEKMQYKNLMVSHSMTAYSNTALWNVLLPLFTFFWCAIWTAPRELKEYYTELNIWGLAKNLSNWSNHACSIGNHVFG